MDVNDLMTLRALERDNSLTPYEQFKTQHMQTKRPSGVGIAGLVTGVAGIVVGIGGAAWAASRAQNAKDVAIAKNDGLRDLVLVNAQSLAAERQERIAGDVNITNTITDTQSGSQQGSLSQSQQLSNDIAIGLMTGKYTEAPQKVELLSPAQPFKCGCGCGND